jgi:hypothetical protein
MKIDIEGMDSVCLLSLFYFSGRPRYISIESEKKSFIKLIKEIKLFNKLGYNKFKAINQKDVIHQREPASAGEDIRIGHIFRFGSSGLFGKDLEGKWLGKYAIISRYILIFIGYFLYGDYGIVTKSKIFKKIRLRLERKLGVSIPGWFDTHAMYV